MNGASDERESHEVTRQRLVRAKALARSPVICCPNCDRPVEELDSARPSYTKPDGVEEEPPLHYLLHPCGCKVHPEWAAAFTAELNRRLDGAVPLLVCPFKPQELDARVRGLEEKITTILGERDMAEGEARRRLEYFLVIAVDELMRLLPGAHNRLPQVDALDPEVAAWAGKNQMHTPPVKKSSEFGYPPGYKSPLAKPDQSAANLCGPGTHAGLTSEASLLGKEEALHVDPAAAAAAAGKEQLKKQRMARQIQNLGGMLSRRTLGEVFNVAISDTQEAVLREAARLEQPAATAAGWTRDLVEAARTFIDHHNLLCLQLVNEQVHHQPVIDTRQAAAALVAVKRNIDEHLAGGRPLSADAAKLLNLIVPVFLPATGMVPTRPGPAPGLPLPVSAAEIKDDFHAQFAPAKRRVVRKKEG